MAVHLVTGYAGAGHVTSADAGLFNSGVCGLDRYVLKTGTKFAFTIESSNLIRIGSGGLVDQGRYINIPINTTVDVTIENGTQGKKRYDLIVMRYNKDVNTAVESASLQVIKGTETSGTPVQPACITGDIYAGALQDDVPLYRVALDGLTITGVTKLYTEISPLADISSVLAEFRSQVLLAAYPVGSIYTSINDADPAMLFGGTWEQISGKFLLSADSAHAAGTTGGAASHTLTAAELPSHAHSLNNHTHTVPAHTHSASTASAGAHTHNVPRWQQATPTAGGEGRLAQGSIDSSYVTSKAGAHTHAVTVASKPAFATTGASGNTGNTGSGTAFSTMPPYLAVYMWKRTA